MFPTLASAAEHGVITTINAIGVPPGFAELTLEHELLVDVYFGDHKVGEAMVVARPGSVRFKDPARIITLIPNIMPSAELSAAFASELPSNAAVACANRNRQGCGSLSPSIAGIIFDEDHFRVDLFVNPKFLELIRPSTSLYLPKPTAPLSLTSSTGVALSGSSDTSPVYNVQNQTILGFRNARIRSDSSYASKFGFIMDTAVGEIDRAGLRYSAGLFWAPGLDLTGPRRIVGLGVTTQFDTRTDRDTLRGTPLVVFLAQPSRVDILVDGRLLTSGSYDAGNNVLDTSTLPDGSYSLLLRIHDANGAVTEERRFFAKNVQIAPLGEPIYFAYGGKLANTRPGRAVSLSDDLFYQFGTARRLTQNVAVDLSLVGTTGKPMVEAGAWLITPLVRVRAAALASSKGDAGALLQIASGQYGSLNANLDLRRIWSRDGGPLLPLPNYASTFEIVDIDGRQIGESSFTQASGSIGYRFGAAYVEVIGSLRKDKGIPLDYSIGPNLNWPVVNSNGLQIALHADAQVTSKAKAGYVGVTMFFNRGAYSVSSSLGRRGVSKNGESASSRAVGDTTAHFSYSDEDGTDLSLAGGVTREMEATAGHAEAMVHSRFGSARGEVSHDFEGTNRTQYGLTLQTGAVLNRNDAVIGGRNLAQSAVIVSVDGVADGSQFDILVDGQSRGRVRAGRRVPLFLEPYHSYSLRLRPVNAASVWFDTAARQFTLYPGNVQHVRWHVEHLLTIFGRAVGTDGKAIADAMVTSRRGIGQSDADGYFQIETSGDDVLSFQTAGGGKCKVMLAGLAGKIDYASVGRVLCQ
ncbi:MAG TPA: TcfC E-set like domain-containing protein [Nitrospira sp.]|nr:TcfC E-set like domain-containing protein [Nitrospira sp.]